MPNLNLRPTFAVRLERRPTMLVEEEAA